MLRLLLVMMTALGLSACASRSIKSVPSEVKVSRDKADDDCREIGKVTGTTPSAEGTQEQALEDLKREAANKGANYVVIKQYSDYGTTVTGVAYECE